MAKDPGGPTFIGGKTALPSDPDKQITKVPPDQELEAAPPAAADDGIRIDLSRIGGRK